MLHLDTVTTNQTTTTTASVTEAVTITAESSVADANNQQYSVTKEELIEKIKDYNFVNYFDRFSADHTFTVYESYEWHREPETCIGKIYLDEVNLTASGTEEVYVNDKCITKSLRAIKDNRSVSADEFWAEIDYNNGGYKLLETPNKHYSESPAGGKAYISFVPDMTVDVTNTDNWEITEERTGNGRKIVTVNGFEKENNNIEGVYREITYIVDIDAETGMRLSYDAYSEGEKIIHIK